MKNCFIAGFDIGGTKCAIVLGKVQEEGKIVVLDRKHFATKKFPIPKDCLTEMCHILNKLLIQYAISKKDICGIGISCGGPLDSVLGIIQSPPNLPGWNDIPIKKIVELQTGLSVKLENDANAGALAEWKFGAGRNTSNMIFLTFGTGLGVGIIANGHLLSGTSGMAGECGHIRLASSGPIGYGKQGSFEGFCSGGGIASLGRYYAEKAIKKGKPFLWCSSFEELPFLNAKKISDAAFQGDQDACAIYSESGFRLGQGLSILIDILNPERIIIGSIFTRCEKLLRPTMEEVLKKEALPQSLQRCKVVPAQLGEAIGDIASLAIIAK